MRTITCTHEVPEQLLKDVLTTAVEGGITYWVIEARKCKRDTDLNVLSIEVTPDEADEAEWKLIDLDTIFLGIQRILQPEFKINERTRENIRRGISNPEDADFDADDADCIVQAGLFGEIVYG